MLTSDIPMYTCNSNLVGVFCALHDVIYVMGFWKYCRLDLQEQEAKAKDQHNTYYGEQVIP